MNATRKRYYDKIVRVTLEIPLHESDIAEKLNEVAKSGETRQSYIKRLIREDIKNQEK